MVGAFGFLSEYYLNNSVFKLEDIFNYAKKENYPFLSLSDGKSLYSLYKLITNKEIPYLAGLLVDVVIDNKKDKLLIYSLNKKGYENLIILSSYLTLKEEELTLEMLLKFKEGLLVITAGYKGLLYEYLNNNYYDEASKLLKVYQSVFNNFYLGLSLQTFDDEIIIAPKVKELSKDLNIKMLPVNFMAYLKEDKSVYNVLAKMHEISNTHDLAFLTLEELKNRYLDYPEVFENLSLVSKLFNFKYEKELFKLPKLTKNSKELLKSLSYKGLKDKSIYKESYLKRLDYELSVITELGYADYFLIVHDFVNYAKTNNILVGPGRGSAAGSLVSYALNITNIDPLKYNLLFERFLNKARKTMPDIDLDFPDNKRDEVILYVANKFGLNHVVSINTFSRYSSKSSLRDVLKIEGYKHYEVNQIVKQINSNSKLNEKLENVKEISNKLDGIPRQTGTHAAGIILASEDLRYKIPLQNGPLINQSQYEFSDLENMGLLKIDFLGIRNLTIIEEVLNVLKNEENVNLKLDDIPLNDDKTYQLLKSGDTTGIFQLESLGMRAFLRKLLPKSFNDIVALLALYRPGPMENIDEFIKRRDSNKYEVLDESLEDVLKETYGIIVYQEQIMEICYKFAGYTLEEADLLRRGISKKDHQILKGEKEKFIKKSLENGKTLSKASLIYDYILKFADYGFNKSHSVSYSLVAYQMAYLKANYYRAFMQVLLSNMSSSDKEIPEIINSLLKQNIKVLPPSINYSEKKFTKKGNNLIFPFTSIKNIGPSVAEVIITEREKGLFLSYEDFKKRLGSSLNKGVLEALIFSNALDEFKLNKKELFETMSDLTHLYENIGLDLKKRTFEEYDLNYLREKEVEMLGFTLTTSLEEAYSNLFNKYTLTKISDLNFNKDFDNTLAILTGLKEIKTKNNDLMAFLTLSDGIYNIDVTIFPKVYLVVKDSLKVNEVYFVKLTKTTYQGDKWSLVNIKNIKE